MVLDKKFGDVDVIFIRVEGLHNVPLETSGHLIHLSQVYYLPLPIFSIAVVKEADLRPIDQLRILVDLRDQAHLVGIQ